MSLVSGFESDLADLIDDHVKSCGGDLSFNAFREHWQRRSFSFVHNARLVEMLEGEYAQMLFTATMPYLAPDAGPTVRRIAGLYALYLLYRTQQLAPRARVYVTPRDVRRIAQLVETCVETGVSDAVRAVKELVDDHAFAVGMSDRTREDAVQDALLGARRNERRRPGDGDRRRGRRRKPTNEPSNGGSSIDARTRAVDTDAPDALDTDALDTDAPDTDTDAEAPDTDDTEIDTDRRARVVLAAASSAALEHLRKTRVPESFQALAEDSAAYGDAMAALFSGPEAAARLAGGGDGRATGTTETHELVRRQVVKYDGKLRAALRPGTGTGTETESSAVAAVPGAAARAGGGTPKLGDLGSERDLGRLGLAKPGRLLSAAPRFGSMPEFPRSRGDEPEDVARDKAPGDARPSRLRDASLAAHEDESDESESDK